MKKKRLADERIRVDRIGLLDLLQWLAMPLEGLASGQRVSRGHSFRLFADWSVLCWPFACVRYLSGENFI